MRLRRIEAVRYGALADVSLGDLADGLTVVHGPNEAGKSTLISLVRHVLYGYPTAREKEAGYVVPGGAARMGRLVFADDDGTWAVERTDGPHGGPVTVRALDGAPRHGLVGELVRGVSADAYRVVFGFGLDEMPRVADSSVSSDDILGKLYAASAGLRVSPQQVRAAIDAEAEAIFKAGARKRSLNTLVAELKRVRSEMRDLARDAEALIAEKGQAESLSAALATAREARETARARLTALTLASRDADERVSVLEAQEELLLGLRRDRSRLADEHDALAVDQALLDAAPDLDAALAEASSCGGVADALTAAEAALVRARTRAQDAAARTGLAAATLAVLADACDLGTTAEEARGELQRLSATHESRREAAQKAAQSLEAARTAAARTLEPLGLTPDDAAALGARYDALDTVEALRARGGAAGPRGSLVPPVVMLVSGLAAAVAGAALAEWISAAIGAVLLGVGAWLLYRSRFGAPALPQADERPHLTLLGLDASAGHADLLRTRRALDAARAALERMDAVGETAAEADRDATLARDALATRRALWEGWLTSRGLDPALSPAAAATLFTAIAEARREEAAVTEAAAEVERLTARLDAVAARLAEAARPFITVPLLVTRDDVPAIANRLAERLASARDAATTRADLERRVGDLDARIEAEQAKSTRAAAELTEILERFDVAEGGSHADLRELQAQADRHAREAEAAFDEIARARNQLEGQLERLGRERAADELRLEEAGLSERVGEMVDRYLVLALASGLLSETQERYGRERQPEVVKHASHVFSTITEGRYTGLSVPLDGGPVEAYDTTSSARKPSELSRGAAEQLYLALRIGLITRLGDVGAGLPVLMDDVLVNFDPARKRGAVDAVAELAASRQVVFFTCHPDTAALFEEAVPGHARLELPRA